MLHIGSHEGSSLLAMYSTLSKKGARSINYQLRVIVKGSPATVGSNTYNIVGIEIDLLEPTLPFKLM